MNRVLYSPDPQTRLIVAGAAAIAAAIAFEALTGAGAPNLVTGLASLAAALVALVALGRAPIGDVPRAALMLALIVAVLLLALRSEFVLLTPVKRGVDAALLADPVPPTPASAAAGETRGGGGGALVTITGDGEAATWATTAQRALGAVGAGIAGAGDWRIAGEAVARGEDGAIALSIAWRIAGHGGEARCGLLSLSAHDPAAAVAALGDAFRRALRSSARSGRPRCM